MFLIIKGVDKPDRCGLCPCFHPEHPMYCQAVKADKSKKISAPYGKPRPEWCPLIEFPSHGRLIDADRLMDRIKEIEFKCIMTGEMYANFFLNNAGNNSVEWWCVEDMIDNEPTVLEAEESQ